MPEQPVPTPAPGGVALLGVSVPARAFGIGAGWLARPAPPDASAETGAGAGPIARAAAEDAVGADAPVARPQLRLVA